MSNGVGTSDGTLIKTTLWMLSHNTSISNAVVNLFTALTKAISLVFKVFEIRVF